MKSRKVSLTCVYVWTGHKSRRFQLSVCLHFMMNLAVEHLNFLFIPWPASLPIKIGPSAHQKYDPEERKRFYDFVSLFQ